MNPTLNLPIIGYLRSPLREKFGTPRQPNLVQVSAYIDFLPPYDNPRAFEGLSDFSHIWLLWQFHHNRDTQFRPQIRPPRLGGNRSVGVFASRSMYRPAPIGLSVVKIIQLDTVDCRIVLGVQGADLIDGTPIIDIKPYIKYADALPHAESGFAPKAPTPLQVQWSAQAEQQQRDYVATGQLSPHDVSCIGQLLAQDPRPAYQNDQREYGMRYDDFNVKFCVIDRVIHLHGIEPV